MAKAEFYEIIIKYNNEVVKDISLNEKIIERLNNNDEHDNFCQKKTCSVILNQFLRDSENKCIFDFSKLTDEEVISTLISEPSKSEDTFAKLHNKLLETTNYTEIEKNIVLEILKNTKNFIERLKKLTLDKFKIYKIILDNNLLEKEKLKEFEDKIIKRLKKDSVFFQIVENFGKFNSNILLFQKITNYLDVKYLEDYLNFHLLQDEKLKVSFHKLYEADFMDFLSNGELTNFTFSYKIQNKNNLLDDKSVTTVFYAINDMLGNNLTTVEIKAEQDKLLDNKKLLEFFEKASDIGLLDNCALRAKGYGAKKINLNDDSVIIQYTEAINISSLEEAKDFFGRALLNKKHIIEKRIGK